jgi:rhodanese-related sulfurtransferase
MAEIVDLNPTDVKRLMDAGEIVLVDVRETNEYAGERIKGALLMPLSTFAPEGLPRDAARPTVFHCGSGKRSARAAEAAQAAGIDVTRHMAGGLAGWKQAGLPTLSVDPATGEMSES